MILTLVHPDYCGSGRNLTEYETLLKQLNEFQSAWRALPSEVSAWWRSRERMRLTVRGDSPSIEGPGLRARRRAEALQRTAARLR